MPESEDPKKFTNNDLHNSQFGGGFINADTVNAGQIGGDIYNIHIGHLLTMTSGNPAQSQNQQQRLQQEKDSLEKVYSLQSQKVAKIRTALVIETDPSRKFQYKHQLQEEERTLKELDDKLNALEKQLQATENSVLEADKSIYIERLPISVISESLLIQKSEPTPVNKNELPVNFQLARSHIQGLSNFHFEVVTVNAQGQIVRKHKGQAEYFTEDLGQGINLDMVFISGGHFLMGSPDATKQNENEQPHHQVVIQPFFLGKHPVTQAQWKVVASLPEIEIKLNPNPSYFKGDNRPVENISWYEANEFCQRLSKYTEREYRLPSEAEWEYACRAGTETPFHFGETITMNLANYLDTQVYKTSTKGKYIGKTTTVMTFLPNSFGLYDMHGNIREWCFDYWHDNYQGAPSNGSAWVTGGSNLYRVLRGGSCLSKLEDCRSNNRYKDVPSSKKYSNGFRIASSSI